MYLHSKIAVSSSTAKIGPVFPDSWKLTKLFQCFLYLLQIFGLKDSHALPVVPWDFTCSFAEKKVPSSM